MLGVALVVTACSPSPAAVDDVTGGPEQIVAVDGGAVQRAHMKYATVIPVVLVTPGTHTFSVIMRARNGGVGRETTQVVGTVQAGKQYVFETVGGDLQLVLQPSDR